MQMYLYIRAPHYLNKKDILTREERKQPLHYSVIPLLALISNARHDVDDVITSRGSPK